MVPQPLRVRPPAVAGTFYPRSPGELQAMVDRFLAATAPDGRPPAAIVTPHAGLVYSGATAAHAWARAGLARSTCRRVIVIGPAHRRAVMGAAACRASAFASPAGEVAVDTETVGIACTLPGVSADTASHQMEHCVEVQLPFLRKVLPDALLVPIIVGHRADETVEALLETLWTDNTTLVAISTDLSHGLPPRAAIQSDERTLASIAALDPRIPDDAACGAPALRALLRVASRRGMHAELLASSSSADAGSDYIVGYGAAAIVAPDPHR